MIFMEELGVEEFEIIQENIYMDFLVTSIKALEMAEYYLVPTFKDKVS